MSDPVSWRLSLTILASALLLAGCDRGADDAAQQQGDLSDEKQTLSDGLSGEIDRSFAGETMPAVTVSDPDGRKLNLSALQGQPVLLNLWATWCAPCVVEMPALDGLAGEMDGRLQVITVSQDLRGAELVIPFFAERKFTHLEPWLDPENQLGFRFAGVLPTTVLYDAQGREVFRVMGGYDWTSEEALAAIEEAVGT